MKKALPPSTVNEISPPNKKYKYFENWQNYPFKDDAINFELANAWWLAEAALLAYADKTFISETFKATGLTNAGFIVRSFEKQGTQCFVAHNDKFIMLVFRGTEVDNFLGSLRDWGTNFNFIPMDDGAGGSVHRGFWDGLSLIWDDEEFKGYIKSIANNDDVRRSLWITGHSLGAALATLAADRAIREERYNVQGVYTYGSPRVGDNGFKSHFSREGLDKKTYRFVNNSDIVARIVPRFLYTHVGYLKYIDTAGHLCSLDDESQIENDTNSLQLQKSLLSIPVPGFIADHAPIYYAIKIWNNL